ncbi:Neural proliferation differentiation and control protein 1 [Acropora cervicornis]|uniref:Neural proliferation differentiation and control protein 1 n=1 Tax=Acropora cervicornis TaxID=6130 RepID=A0AAD9QTM0_ACRCE|nr:Neural proliferation differentiation and control protein 1 [Acropora cervicornis]
MFRSPVAVSRSVEQKRSSFDNLVVTDGNELQKVLERTKYDPTTATKLSEDEVDLKNSRREDLSENTKYKSLKSEDGEENSAKQISEDKTSSGPRNNKKRLTSESEKKFKKLHDIRSNRNYKLGERLNIDPERSKDQDHAVRNSVTKLSKKKSAEPAVHGEEAKFEASIGDKSPSVPDSNSSTSTPPPYVLKVKNTPARAELDDIYFLFIVIGCSVAGIAGLHTTAKAVSEAEYAGYTAVKKGPPSTQGDHKLDYSAEIYHYQQTKSQISAMEKAGGAKGSIKGETLDDEENSDEGDEEDYTVYECHGLAPHGDMTVVNPLFSDQEVVGSDQDGNGDRSVAFTSEANESLRALA